MFRMIIACPACGTRYAVPDSAIGAEGRTVRCAKCRHSWYQDGPELVVPPPPPPAAEPQPAPEVAPASEPAERPIEAASVETPADPAPAQPGFSERFTAPDEAPDAPIAAFREPAAPVVPGPSDYGEEVSQFDYAPPFRPRRNTLKLWTIAGGLFAVLAVGTVGAVSYFGLPDWVPVSRPTFGLEQPDLVLDFPRAQQERRTLPNGTEYFGASGTVKNVGRETRAVPPILIVLRDARERIVYSWEIPPPKSRLAPGETVTINEAVTDVPRSAKVAEIGWKPG